MIECEFQKNVPVPDGGSSAPCSFIYTGRTAHNERESKDIPQVFYCNLSYL